MLELDDQKATRLAKVYEQGEWRLGPSYLDPMQGEYNQQALRKAGFRPFHHVGSALSGQVSLLINESDLRWPTCCLVVYGLGSGSGRGERTYLYAATISDALDLMARWAPAFQAGCSC